MTDKELDLMERLWHVGVPAKDIARHLSYAHSTILYVARHDRERFPPRQRARKLTEKKLERMRQLWAEGVTAKRIASELGISTNYVVQIAMRDRESFPRRQGRDTHPDADLWLERIRTGRATKVRAAKELGVSITTIKRWLREDKDTRA